MKAGKSSGKWLYLKTRYWTPERCGYCDSNHLLIPFAEYLRQKGISRRKGETLLKRHYLLAKYVSKIAPRGMFFVMENPEMPPGEYEFTHRLYGSGRNRKRSKSRGTFKSELEYYNQKASEPIDEITEAWETPNWLGVAIDLDSFDQG